MPPLLRWFPQLDNHSKPPFFEVMFQFATITRRLRAKEHRLGVQQRHGLDGEEETFKVRRHDVMGFFSNR